MTYSNRPVSTSYQHESEFDRSSDAVSLNKLNTFVMGSEMSLPGTWSNPYPFSASVKLTDKESIDEKTHSPICNVGITAGDKTIDMCKPAKPNCPIHRPLEPRRNIMPGMWTYNKVSTNMKKKINIIVPILFIVLLLVLITQL